MARTLLNQAQQVDDILQYKVVQSNQQFQINGADGSWVSLGPPFEFSFTPLRADSSLLLTMVFGHDHGTTWRANLMQLLSSSNSNMSGAITRAMGTMVSYADWDMTGEMSHTRSVWAPGSTSTIYFQVQRNTEPSGGTQYLNSFGVNQEGGASGFYGGAFVSITEIAASIISS